MAFWPHLDAMRTSRRFVVGGILAILLWGMASVLYAQDGIGGVRGAVSDAEFDGPVPDASVRIVELNLRATTSSDGFFVIENVPAGSFTVTVSAEGFQSFTKGGVVVVPGALAEVNVDLRPEIVELEEYVFEDADAFDSSSEASATEIRQQSTAVQDVLSKDFLSKAGISDAAGAVKNIVGASLVDGKFATVRGLSDRYVGGSMNGMRIPSADPKKRAVQLDLIPASAIETLAVTKTAVPEVPGDWTGGGINILTVGVPDEDFLKLSFSKKHFQGQTGKDNFVTYDGGGTGVWGRHAGARDIPNATVGLDGLTDGVDRGLGEGARAFYINEVSSDNPHDTEYLRTDEGTKALSPAMGTRIQKTPESSSVKMSTGIRRPFAEENAWGALVGINYGREFTSRLAVNRDGTISANDEFEEDTMSLRGTEELKWSTVLAGGLEFGENHKVNVLGLRSRVAEDQAIIEIEEPGLTPFQSLEDGDFYKTEQAIRYTERSLNILQFYGEHDWPELFDAKRGMKWKWFFSRAGTTQEEPDTRFFDYYTIRDPGDTFTYNRQAPGSAGSAREATRRVWRYNEENNSLFGSDFEFRFPRTVPDLHTQFITLGADEPNWETKDATLKLGFSRDYTTRESTQESYLYDFGTSSIGRPGPLAEDLAEARTYLSPAGNEDPSVLWTDFFTDEERLGTRLGQNSIAWYIAPDEQGNDISYEGTQELFGGYWGLEMPITKQLTFSIGSRLEYTNIQATPESDAINENTGLQIFRILEEVPLDNGGSLWQLTGGGQGLPVEEVSVDLQDSSWLRSAGITYDIREGMKARLNYGQTIARPTFLELVPVLTEDFVDNETTSGNRDLKISAIDNLDFRWEWFPNPGDVIAMSWFYKKITDPIEKTQAVVNELQILVPENFPEGTVRGFEIEGKKKLKGWGILNDVSIGINATLLDAEVKVPEERQLAVEPLGLDEKRRRMEGQPEFLFNFTMQYDSEEMGTSAGVFYNLVGETLVAGAAATAAGGDEALPNLFNERVGTLDLSFSQKFLNGWKVTARAKNVLDPLIEQLYITPDDEKTVRRAYRKGVNYSLGVSKEW